MKKVVLSLSAIIILGLTLCVFQGVFLLKADHFKVYSNTGKPIPAKLYIQHPVADSMVYLLVFDKSLLFKNDHGLFVIDMENKFMGIPDLSSGAIINLPGKYAFQRKRNPNVTGAIGSEFFFDEKILDYAIFNRNSITFNTFGPLKQYGDSVILTVW